MSEQDAAFGITEADLQEWWRDWPDYIASMSPWRGRALSLIAALSAARQAPTYEDGLRMIGVFICHLKGHAILRGQELARSGEPACLACALEADVARLEAALEEAERRLATLEAAADDIVRDAQDLDNGGYVVRARQIAALRAALAGKETSE